MSLKPLQSMRVSALPLLVGSLFYSGSGPSFSQQPGVSHPADWGEGSGALRRRLVGGGGIPQSVNTVKRYINEDHLPYNYLKILSNWMFHRWVEKVEEKIMCSTTLYCLKLILSDQRN